MLSEQELNALAKIAGVSFSFGEPVDSIGLQVWEAIISKADEPHNVLCISMYKRSKLEAMNNAWAKFMTLHTLFDL